MQSFDISITPSGPLGGYLKVPPSKNYTTRLILMAAMAQGRSTVNNPATNDDAQALITCLRSMGAKINIHEHRADTLQIDGVGGNPKNPGRLNPQNAGAVLRFLMGTVCLTEGETLFETDYTHSLGKRPNQDLITALRLLGARVEAADDEGRLPIRICGGKSLMRGTQITINGTKSSQYLSSLLMLAPFLSPSNEKQITIEVRPQVLVSRPAIEQTLDTLHRFGLRADSDWSSLTFKVPTNQTAQAGDYFVGGDWPSAAALMAAVAIAGGLVTLYGLREDAQGERKVVEVFKAMGCKITSQSETGKLQIHSKCHLSAITFDGDLATDAVLAMVAAACFAKGTSRFENIANLRIKECDRIAETVKRLRHLGVKIEGGENWIEVTGSPEGYTGGIELDACGDHRVAQMLAIIGIGCRQGLRVKDAHCITKSYPDFFEDLSAIGVLLKTEKV